MNTTPANPVNAISEKRYHCWRCQKFDGAEIKSLHKVGRPFKTRPDARRYMEIHPQIHIILPSEAPYCQTTDAIIGR